MLRKSMAVMALLTMVTLSACNHITAPATGNGTSLTPGGPGPQPPREIEKVCLSDLRAVRVTAPAEGTLLYGGDALLISWALTEVCGHYWADVEASIDNGRTFTLVSHARDSMSASWSVPNTDGAAVVLRLTIHDGVGDMVEELAFNNRLIGRHVKQNKNPHQYE